MLMDLDIQAAMKQKIGTLLPCNVVVCVEGDKTIVSFMDPQAMKQMTDYPQVHAVAGDALAAHR